MPWVLRACLNSDCALVFRVELHSDQTTGPWRFGRRGFPWVRATQIRRCSVYNIGMPFRVQGNPNAAKHGRTPPPEETFEEASFLKTLGEKQKPVSVKLMDGQTVSGWIEYYDKYMVRLTREGAPNLFIFKHEIMYIAEDGGKRKGS